MPAHQFRIGFAIALLNGLNNLVLVVDKFLLSEALYPIS
jgi:hypothetical protein